MAFELKNLKVPKARDSITKIPLPVNERGKWQCAGYKKNVI
jgi:hypothetical protein